MAPGQKRAKAKTTSVRRSSRVAARLGWRIPPEILLLIMRELHNSRSTLKTASLVCRAWRGPAQVFLFSQMRLESREDCKRLTKIFQKSPHIAHSVTRLILVEYDDPSLPALRLLTRTLNGFPTRFKSPYLASQLAVDIAEKLGSSVRELGMSVFPFGPHTIAFLKHLRRVRTLKISDCEDMPLQSFSEVVEGMPELSSLHVLCGDSYPDPDKYLNDAGAPSASSSAVSQDTSPIQLNTLVLEKIEHRFDFMKYLLDSGRFDFQNLESLGLMWMEVEDQMDIPSLDFRYMDKLFEQTGPYVKSFKLGFSGGSSRSEDKYLEHLTSASCISSLSRLTALNSFNVECKNTSYYGFDPSPYISLLTALPASSLTTVTLDTYADVKNFPESEQPHFNEREEEPGPTWHALDRLLADETRFPGLQSVLIIAKLEYDPAMVNMSGLEDVRGCGSPGCIFCTHAAVMRAEERSGAKKNEEESVQQNCVLLSTWFNEALVRLRERGILHVVVDKLNRAEEFKRMRDDIVDFQWDD